MFAIVAKLKCWITLNLNETLLQFKGRAKGDLNPKTLSMGFFVSYINLLIKLHKINFPHIFNVWFEKGLVKFL